MLDREKVIVALDEKRVQFEEYAGGLRNQHDAIRTRLAKLQEYDYHALSNFLDTLGDTPKGALPTPEWDEATDLCLPFGQKWANHEDARAWALEVLTGRPVAAVDGSQIPPSKDFNIPVGAIQIGWFINPHQAGTPYVKNISFSVLSPNELDDGIDEVVDDRAMPSGRVTLERFMGECDQICKIMADYADAPQRAKPLCFFDGSLIVSFAVQLRAGQAQTYLNAVRKLVDCSRDSRVPLVAFVDRSYSHDFVNLVDTVSSTQLGGEKLTISDAGLLDGYLRNWGDRTPLFYCDREDNLRREYDATLYNDVAFTYVRLTRDRVPARLEMPHWIVDEGLAEDVLNLVRAECVVGGGYPYAAETADALAVISHADREHFYRLFEQFARQSGLELVQARKAASKVARR
ncbi:MAG: DNA double-strand break repair nuclease NurA [Caldilineaceae bacterium]|nr:DNA double-strand break repair nuclease NurA [Caldilineaceae bacterium]